MKQLFIVGCPRSGTTLLQQALNRHPEIVIPPETRFFVDALSPIRLIRRYRFSRINEDLGIALPPPQNRRLSRKDAIGLFEGLARLYLQRTGRATPTYFGEKTPDHLLCVDRIVRLFPEARILIIQRDGRDVALSLTKVPFSSSDLYVNFGTWLKYYRHQKQAMARHSMHCLGVKYEELVSAPEHTLRTVSAFLGVDYDPAMSREHGNREGTLEWERSWKHRALKRITTDRIGVWRRELSESQIERLEAWGGEVLCRLGYELTPNPARRLPASFRLRVQSRRMRWQFAWSCKLLRRLIRRWRGGFASDGVETLLRPERPHSA